MMSNGSTNMISHPLLFDNIKRIIQRLKTGSHNNIYDHELDYVNLNLDSDYSKEVGRRKQALIESVVPVAIEHLFLGLREVLGSSRDDNNSNNRDAERDNVDDFNQYKIHIRNMFHNEAYRDVLDEFCKHVSVLTGEIRHSASLKSLCIHYSFLNAIKDKERTLLFEAIGGGGRECGSSSETRAGTATTTETTATNCLEHLKVDARFCYDFHIDLVTKALCGGDGGGSSTSSGIQSFQLEHCVLIGEIRGFLAFLNAMRAKCRRYRHYHHICRSIKNDTAMPTAPKLLQKISLVSVKFPTLLTFEAMVQALAQLQVLQDVHLDSVAVQSSNLLSDENGGQSLARNLLQSCCKSLRRFSLENTNISRKTAFAIANSIRQYPVLLPHDNDTNSSCSNTIPKAAVAALETLRIVSSPYMDDVACEAIVYELCKVVGGNGAGSGKSSLCKLKSLTLSDCNIGHRTMKGIGQLLMKDNSYSGTGTIQYLDLSCNHNIGQDIEGCMRIISHQVLSSKNCCSSLEHLVLYDCNVTVHGCIMLANALKQQQCNNNNKNDTTTKLRTLDIRNEIDESDTHSYDNDPESVFYCVKRTDDSVSVSGTGEADDTINDHTNNDNNTSTNSSITDIGYKVFSNILENCNWVLEVVLLDHLLPGTNGINNIATINNHHDEEQQHQNQDDEDVENIEQQQQVMVMINKNDNKYDDVGISITAMTEDNTEGKHSQCYYHNYYRDKMNMHLALNRIWNRNRIFNTNINDLTKEEYVVNLSTSCDKNESSRSSLTTTTSSTFDKDFDTINKAQPGVLLSNIQLSIMYYWVRLNPSLLFDDNNYDDDDDTTKSKHINTSSSSSSKKATTTLSATTFRTDLREKKKNSVIFMSKSLHKLRPPKKKQKKEKTA